MEEVVRVHLIGCGVMEPDLQRVAGRLGIAVTTDFLEAGLHDDPVELRRRLQARIDAVSGRRGLERIVLAYGVCGRGLVGVHARRLPLAIPRVQDCIALFLGSDDAYRKQFAACPGTFYTSAGWYEKKVQPRRCRERHAPTSDRPIQRPLPAPDIDRLRARYGDDNARAIIDFLDSWKHNYSRSVFIDTGAGNPDAYEAYARALADELNWDYERVQGNDALLEQLLLAHGSSNEIIWVPPHHLTQFDPLTRGLGAAPVWQAGMTATRPAPIAEQPRAPVAVTRPTRTRLALGIDAGGTYTDIAVYDFARQRVLAKAKAITTRWDYTAGICEALERIDAQYLARIDLVAISTTLATNAIVEGQGEPVALLVMPPSGRLAPGSIRHQPVSVIRGQLEIGGAEREPVDPDQVRAVVRAAREQHDVRGFAVSGYAATVNPAHEIAVRDMIRNETGLPVICGHELSDQLNFIVRANTAALNARIIPLISRFLEDVARALASREIQAPMVVVRSDGSLMSSDLARERPIETMLSGPAASVAGARHLTGLADATVLDMGGTTSDFARVRGGRVEICAAGASVGRWRTHVQALDMSTIGLGGDSAVRLRKRKLEVGPRRVAPVGWLATVDHRLHEALDDVEKRAGDFLIDTEPMEFLLLGRHDPALSLTAQEAAVLQVLERGPQSLAQVAVAVGCGHWKLLRLDRLEARCAVQRCGLTPTDLLQAQGAVQLWDRAASARLVRIVSGLLEIDAETLYAEVMRQMVDRLTVELLKRQMDTAVTDAEGAACALCEALLNNLLDGGDEHFRIAVSFKHPVIGLGAPISFFLPQAAARLGAEVIIPEHADAANAVGAATSWVSVSRRCRIQPSDLGGYHVHGLAGRPAFADFAAAHDHAVAALRDELVQLAQAAGTSCRRVELGVDDRIATAADGTQILLERIVNGVISGPPDAVPVPG